MATSPTVGEAENLMQIPPGISFTAPPKSRGWQQPPKFTKITDVAENYIAMIASKEMANDLLDTLETGVPLAVIAETFMLASVQKGIHTIDAGILVLPIIIEMLKTVAMMNKIEVYTYPDDYDNEIKMSSRVVKQAVKAVFKKEEPAMAEEAVTEEAPVGGLMAKPKKEMV